MVLRVSAMEREAGDSVLRGLYWRRGVSVLRSLYLGGMQGVCHVPGR